MVRAPSHSQHLVETFNLLPSPSPHRDSSHAIPKHTHTLTLIRTKLSLFYQTSIHPRHIHYLIIINITTSSTASTCAPPSSSASPRSSPPSLARLVSHVTPPSIEFTLEYPREPQSLTYI